MARLFSTTPHEIAPRGELRATIEPNAPGTSSSATVDLWHRVVRFNAPLGDYDLAGTFDDDAEITQATLTGSGMSLPAGAVYQARLFREGTGNETGTGEVFGVLGRLDAPHLDPELRSDLLTRCTEGQPQVKIETGGTYVGFTIAGAAKTCLRVQLGSEPPHISDEQLPAFKPEHLVATGLSLDPGFVHTLDVIDVLTESDTHGHTPLVAGQELWFIALAWTEDEWDYVWGTESLAPGNPHSHTSLKTESRVVHVALDSLYSFDDSDELSSGEATFSLGLTGPGVSETLSVRWNPMETGTSLDLGSGSSFLIPNAPNLLNLTIRGVEDDSPAEDDIAETSRWRVPMPVGRVTEDVRNAKVQLKSRHVSGSGGLAFRADIRYSVLYT